VQALTLYTLTVFGSTAFYDFQSPPIIASSFALSMKKPVASVGDMMRVTGYNYFCKCLIGHLKYPAVMS
jgi:hypothetical protein